MSTNAQTDPLVETAQQFSVSVVIPLFNKEAAIERTLQSLLAQSRLPDELVIVDDGSSDRSHALSESFLSRVQPAFPWRIISQQNCGASKARNRGASDSGSRFIAFLDADDEWQPGHLAELAKLAASFSDATFLSTYYVYTDGKEDFTASPTSLPPCFFGIVNRPLLAYAKGRGLFSSPSVAVRRDAWQRSGGFPLDADTGEDVFLWLKLCMTEVVAHSNTPLVIVHAEHSSQDSRNLSIGYHFRYFLGTPEGRVFLRHRDLATFLGMNLLAHIKWRRVMGHDAVLPQLKRLSRALPAKWRAACLLASNVPLWCLRSADVVKDHLRSATGRKR